MKIVVFGASGVAGAGSLRAALDDPRVTEVVAIVRKPLGFSDAKLREITCANFLDLSPLADALAGADACFYCLGVSTSQVPDAAKYREVTYDYALAAGRALLAKSPSVV